MTELDTDRIAKEEFKTLNKKRFKEIKKIDTESPDIFILCKNVDTVERIQQTVSQLSYQTVGISSNGRQSIGDIKRLKPDLIFIGVDLDGSWDGIKTGRELIKYNIPLIYIFSNDTDVENDDFLLSNYGFIFENYTHDQIKFAIEIALKAHLENIVSVEKFEDSLSEKNTELVVEKFYSVLILALSVALILSGIVQRNVTFIQWIIFIPSASMLITVAFSLKKQKEVIPYEEPPFVSIFIPAHNEEGTIEKTVRSIASMDYTLNGETNYELIVVNDGSTDSTGEILENVKKDFEHVKIITRKPPKSGKGKGFVLNDGLILAKGDIIGIFDADTQVVPEYLSTIIPYLNHPDVEAVQSRVRMYNFEENYLARMQDVEFSGFGNVLRAKDNEGFYGFLGGNGQFTKKRAVMSAGQWDGFAVTEDLNLSVKIALKGGRIRYCPEVAVYQEAVSEWGPFLKQRTRWAMGNFETLFIFASRIIVSKIPILEKIGILSHVSYYAFNLFIFIGFIIFIINVLAWFIWGIPTVIRMEAPLIIGVTSAIAFLPATAISLFRDDKRYLTFLKDLIFYWIYCFYLIPLFFRVMWVLITRRERTWDKTEHKGVKNEEQG